MQGDGRAPSPPGGEPQSPQGAAGAALPPPLPQGTPAAPAAGVQAEPGVRARAASIDLSDEAELLPASVQSVDGALPPSVPSIEVDVASVKSVDVEVAPPSESVDVLSSVDDVTGGVDVDVEEGSVDNLLAMTGENWSIDVQRETLKEAAKDGAPEGEDHDEPRHDGRPSLSIPTPYDFGAADLESEPSASRTSSTARAFPPPLPAAGVPAAGVPAASAPQAAQVPSRPPGAATPSTKPSVPPPPSRERDDSSLRPPPLPSNRPPPLGSASSSRPGDLGSAAVAPPSEPQSGPGISPSRRPPPLPRADALAALPPAPAEAPAVPGANDGGALVDLLAARVERLGASGDTVGLARAHLELAIVHETSADDARVNAAAEAALTIAPDLAAAHAILRRRVHARTQLVPMLRHLERELAVATGESAAVELLAEKARLLDAGDRHDDARAAWELALLRAPHHAAALKGLEAELVRQAFTVGDDRAWEDLVTHLGRLADAFASQPALAGWLHVERARILELRLGRVDAARGAYERALRLDGGVGPVRDAVTAHAAGHHDSARLAALLADEARLEPERSRCARLELDAACITHTLLGDEARAIDLLERAAARAPTAPSVDRRVLDELVRHYEASAQWHEAARARRLRLRFFSDATALIYELRRLSSIEERLGNMEASIGDVERALAIDPDDDTMREELDRLLTAAGKDDERVALWHNEAQRVVDPLARARSLARAASLAENLGRHDDALRHLRAAWVAAPGDAEVLDQLSRLMSPTPSDTFDREVRALIELYAQAAQATDDAGRRVAYLEKVATLWEELIGDPLRAARTYEEILRIEPDRRGAVLGLERTAGRVGDDRALSTALAAEARLAEGGAAVLALRVRSAQVLARVDPARAIAQVLEVLEQDPNHAEARALETRLHEDAGRWELAASSLRARVELASKKRDQVALWLALAHVLDARLRDPRAAVEALQAAREVDPVHPVPPEEIARVLDAAGDARALRVAIEQLASDAITPQERARHLTRAAELDELRLDDDVSAAELYARALAETPDDEMIADRLLRVLSRRAVSTAGAAGPSTFGTPAWAALLDQLARRRGHATAEGQAEAFGFLLASLLVTACDDPGADLPRAGAILDAILARDPGHVGALRLAEAVARRGTSHAALARVLRLQGEGYTDVRARLSSLWELASLEGWRLGGGDSIDTYARILELDPTDPSALEGALRLSLGATRRSDPSARRAAIAALRSLAALAQDEGARLASSLRLALLLEGHANDTQDPEESDPAFREALDRLREALALDPLSVTAATSLARLANLLGDTSGAAAAAISLADLSVHPKVRARYLIDAANLLLSDAVDEALGPMGDRTERAASLLEKALDSDPNSAVAATRLAQVRAVQHRGERLIDVFRTALSLATQTDAVVLLGSEVARVARDDLGEIGVAIEAMRRVREAAPDHVPSLLTLSELFIAQRAWPEAVETLEGIVERGKESAPRITALFALASVFEKILARPDDAERALRRALGIEGENPRAIRALIHRLAAKQTQPDGATPKAQRAPAKVEIAGLLERLALVEPEPHLKCDIFLELAELRASLKDMSQAERALVDAVAVAPAHPRAFARLGRFFRAPDAPGGVDGVSYARALAAVIGRGQQLGTSDPRWFAALGRIEISQLNRLRDGVTHLTRAVQMAPHLHESRYELATAYARLGAHDEAARTLLSMLSPTAQPLMAVSEPAAALELLERALSAERRPDEAVVVSELRALTGELDEARHAFLRARKLGPFEPPHAPLDRATLVGHVVPPEGRHVLLDIAHAIAGLETKLLRADIGEIGVTARDRVGKRSGNPTRALLDRLAKALGLGEVELVITPNVSRTRVLAQDALWVVVPKSLTDLPEPTQLASIGRALARIALNVPWLEELPPPHIEAMLYAAGRTVSPAFGKDDLGGPALKLVAQYEPNVVKELTRKHRANLEKVIATTKGQEARASSVEVLIGALARAELRIAYLLTGDVLATIDELRQLDPAFLKATETPGRKAVGAALDHPFAGDVIRYALSPEATALRRRVGSTWGG